MLHQDISDISLRHLSSIGLNSEDKPFQYKYGSTIKSLLVNDRIDMEVTFISSSVFHITLPSGDYNQAIFNDLYFGLIRIEEQCKNLEYLIKSDAQAAWLLVTAYYASYFMVNDISKANGRFTTNLNQLEYESILATQPKSFRDTITAESNNPFYVLVEHGDMSGEIQLTLRKSSPKPHQVAWSNFSQIANKIKISDDRLTYLLLLKSIVSPEDNGWEYPSNVRNAWNYSQPNYFGDKGSEIAKTFCSIIKSPESTFKWARNNNLKPTYENLAASIAYVYHTLRLSHRLIIERLKII